MNLSTIIQQNDNSVSCEIEEQTVLLNVEAGKYHGFNEVASRIWQLIESPVQVSDICNALTAEFEVSDEECKAEVLSFLDKLASAGLISTRD